MSMGYVLYNTRAGKFNEEMPLEEMCSILLQPVKCINIESITNYRAFFSGLESCDYVVICGGDGTLNRFVNDTEDIEYDCDIFYFPTGTGNDFAREMGYPKNSAPFKVTEYISNLPSVTVKGHRYKFINGIGYGIDGYCCEEGDKIREKSKRSINYTGIAIKGLLYKYKPTDAKITVDGVEHTYKKVWLAPTMNGKFYGGGMLPAPSQTRGTDTLSTMVFYGSGKVKSLIMFPSIFKGNHIKYKGNVEVLQGHEIKVEFDRPTPLQIDGETILDVTSYTAVAYA